ncbi:AMP-binding protein [Terrilactibacillus sp. S3-3]|nr:AMP-binding protein [Terrilactibacillus sp. S3-3]
MSVHTMDMKRVSYQKLWESSLSLAASIRELDIQKGDKIAVCLPNWNEFIVIAMAAAHLGAVLVPFNTRYRQDEVAYILGNSGAKIAFFTEEFDASASVMVPNLFQRKSNFKV